MNIFEHSNWLFISFEQAAGGHRLARVLATLPEVYWYSHPDNGINPWNVYTPRTSIQQRKISRFHYNRYLPDGRHLPPPHDFVQTYIPDANEYYTKIFEPKFKEEGGKELLDNYILPYCTHALPRDIYRQFPNAKIINIVHDVDACIKRYMKVGLEFPGYVRHSTTVPKENERVQFLQKLYNQNKDLKVKDVWAYERFSTFWDKKYYNKLEMDKRTFFEFRREARETTYHKNVLNITNVRDYKLMKDFIRGHLEINIPDWSTRVKMECNQLGLE
jgi:hypothetical protein